MNAMSGFGGTRILAPIKWLILAIQFGTIVPTPAVQNMTEKDIRRGVLFFPIIGLALGYVLYICQAALGHHISRTAATFLALTLYTLATGALHLDGLMDTADAIGSRRPRDRALEIMKDSRVGAMGVVVGILALLGKFAAISSLKLEHCAPFIIVPMLSRLSMIWSMVIAPSARREGLGSLFARKIPFWVVSIASVFSGIVCFWVRPRLQTLWVILLAIVITVIFTGWMWKRFGGTTGDTYGALNEIIEWALWLIYVGLGA